MAVIKLGISGNLRRAGVRWEDGVDQPSPRLTHRKTCRHGFKGELDGLLVEMSAPDIPTVTIQKGSMV